MILHQNREKIRGKKDIKIKLINLDLKRNQSMWITFLYDYFFRKEESWELERIESKVKKRKITSHWRAKFLFT